MYPPTLVRRTLLFTIPFLLWSPIASASSGLASGLIDGQVTATTGVNGAVDTATEALHYDGLLEKQLESSKQKLSRLLKLQSDPITNRYVSSGELADKKLSVEQAELELKAAKRNQQAAIKAAELAQLATQKSQESAVEAG